MLGGHDPVFLSRRAEIISGLEFCHVLKITDLPDLRLLEDEGVLVLSSL